MRVTTIAVLTVLTFALTALAEEIAGIGVDFTQKTNELVKAYRIHPGSPAEKAGMKPGGYLISVDGTNVVSMSLKQAVMLVRGPVGTPVTIQLADMDKAHTNTFKIKRNRMVIVDDKFQFTDHWIIGPTTACTGLLDCGQITCRKSFARSPWVRSFGGEMSEAKVIPPVIRSLQRGRWRSFLLVAGGAQAIALFGCPMMDTPHSIPRQPVFVTVVICLVPILSSLFLLFRYRTVAERIIAYCSLVASLFWLAVGAASIQHAVKMSVVRAQSPNPALQATAAPQRGWWFVKIQILILRPISHSAAVPEFTSEVIRQEFFDFFSHQWRSA
jgi:hypothetical protein